MEYIHIKRVAQIAEGKRNYTFKINYSSTSGRTFKKALKKIGFFLNNFEIKQLLSFHHHSTDLIWNKLPKKKQLIAFTKARTVNEGIKLDMIEK